MASAAAVATPTHAAGIDSSSQEAKTSPDTTGSTADGKTVTSSTVSETTHMQPTAQSSLPYSSADGLIRTPFDRPLDSCKPSTPPTLTVEEQVSYDRLLEKVSQWAEVPESLAKGAKSVPLNDDEQMFLTRECLLRSLRADKWDVEKAETRLKGTISWRREYGVDRITADYISIELETGKMVNLGYDNESRPCIYMRPCYQNTEKSDRQIEALVYLLERAIDVLPPGQENLTFLINFADTQKGQGATVAQGRQSLYILQNHYPERLGRSLVTNIPWYINVFLKCITPFIDPNTRQKIILNDDMANHVPRGQLLKESGGEVEFEYDHSKFWPALHELCRTRREQYKDRWIKAGKNVGESEVYLRGGAAKSVAEGQ